MTSLVRDHGVQYLFAATILMAFFKSSPDFSSLGG
jgi:hypothetical protein